MSAKFKRKNKDQRRYYSLSSLVDDDSKRSEFLRLFPEITEELLNKINSFCRKSDYFLVEENGALALFDDNKYYFIDLESEFNYHKSFYQNRGYKKEELYKALKSDQMQVVDVTGGFLGDSILLVFWGFYVETYEANPIQSALILNALKRFPIKNFTFHPFEFRGVRAHSVKEDSVIYYDPFFRKKKEKTEPNKNILMLREFDKFDFLKLEDFRSFKLVVKRPIKGNPVYPNPDYSLKTKSIRYDVYLTKLNN